MMAACFRCHSGLWTTSRRRWHALSAVTLVCLVGLTVMGKGGAFAFGSVHQSKSVNVAVRTKWTGTSLLLEASELMGKEGDHLFWRFVEDWLKISHGKKHLEQPSDKDCMELILDQGSTLLGRTLAPLFHISLLLRSLSPRVVLYRQLAQESLAAHFGTNSLHNQSGDPSSSTVVKGTVGGAEVVGAWSSSKNPSGPQGKCCWVDIGSRLFLEESELAELLELESTDERSDVKGDDLELYDFDHIYSETKSGGLVAILYGSLGTPCFERFHSSLIEASKKGRIKYILRPVLPSGCEFSAESCSKVGTRGAVNLGGYGVELALKNMEYKAIDDSEVRKGDDSEDGREDDDLSHEVKGFIFSKLLERGPELEGELLTFRDHLLSSGLDTMNVWELKDLGYQTAQRIILASEPLRLMQEINQNLPNLVSSLSRMKLNDTIKEEIIANQRMVPPGKNLFAINGALVNPETLDLFSLLEIVESELSVAGKIADLKVPTKYVKKLLQLTEAGESNTFRLDFRSEHVYYLNNIEQDSMYRRWRNNLNELLMPIYPGQMRYIRRNLYHCVYVIDPAVPSGLKMVDVMTYYFQNSVPMRFGVIFKSSKLMNKIESDGGEILLSDKSYEEDEDVSELVIHMFQYLKQKFEASTGFGFLNLVNEGLEGAGEADNEPIPASYAEDAFIDILRAKGRSGTSVLQALKDKRQYKDEVLKSTLFVYNLGLSQIHPCLLMNGLVYGSGEGQNAAISAMNEEQGRMQEAVYYGRINARTDILDKFLSDSGQRRYNPQIVATKKEDRKYVALSRSVAEKAEVLSRLQYLHHPGSNASTDQF